MICIRPDGKKYEGEWYNGKQNGRGFYQNSKGVVRLAEWKDGKKIKWISDDNKNGDNNPPDE